MTLLSGVLALLSAAAPVRAADAASVAATVYGGDRLPLVAPGGEVKGGKDGALTRPIRFGTPGVWYLWIRASAKGPHGATLTWDLDGEQPLHSGRCRIQVPPFSAGQWLNASMQPNHKASVHVDAAGEHVLRLKSVDGEAVIEKVALTLFFSAKPQGDTLDHADDPGGGRAVFPQGDRTQDGYRPGWASPPVKAARTFYVDDVAGNDSSTGASPAAAWRSVRRANAAAFSPGDALLFKRGGAWDEGLAPRGSGTRNAPITIGAYGEGRKPRLNGVNHAAVQLRDQDWWTVQDLDLTSDPAYGKCGLAIESVEGRPRPTGFHVYNVTAFDNGGAGIRAGPTGDKDNGCDGVWIENCLSFCNGGDGIGMHGNDQVGCRNGVIRYCTAWENRGTGGIYMSGGQNGLIEHCVGYNNIVINIWVWNAINVTMRHCEAWRGHEADAGGFDIDWSCEACTMEYCYAHHNEGVGFLLQGSGWILYRGYPMESKYNIMRYCVSEHDNPPIGMVETFEQGKVYNNLAIARRPGRVALSVGGWPEKPVDWYNDAGGWPSDTLFCNNILVGQDGGIPMHIDDYATRQRNEFDHDLFWQTGAGKSPLIKWAGRENGPGFWWGDAKTGSFPAEEYRDLAAFRKATGEEAHGMVADPRLPGLGEGWYGRLPLAALKPGADSPVAKAGRPVEISAAWLAARAKFLTETGAAAWGIPMAPGPATVDYWGQPVDPAAPATGPGEIR